MYDTVEVAAIETRFPDRESARRALSGAQGETANRFFRAATSKCVDFRITALKEGGVRLEFFAPANNPGYGKRYAQEIERTGVVVRWYKETWGPEGLIETKWLKGEPP